MKETFADILHELYTIEFFSFECRKTETNKKNTLSNDKEHRDTSE